MDEVDAHGVGAGEAVGSGAVEVGGWLRESRLPQPATDFNRTGPNRLTSPDTVSVYLIHGCGFTPIEPSTPSIGLGGLVPPPPIPFNWIGPRTGLRRS